MDHSGLLLLLNALAYFLLIFNISMLTVPYKLGWPVYIHKVKLGHRIYGHKTIAILWVYHSIMHGVNGRRFVALLK